ncbi:MAG: protein kinase [Ignavibacteriales bacterium]|nr:protein kinase [Ignavibacteriales bacterium]
MIGSVIENYKVISMLGEGGMGVVYKALDMKLERFVALKILSSQSATNPQFIERFKREARNQAKLTHPNIVPVYGFTDDHGVLGIAMEFVEGETLEKIIYKKKRLDALEALQIVKQILQGVGYAHTKGFIHRDIKPSNIILSKEGTVKIMDFGISKSMFDKGITKTGTKIGTILYMSPEQIRAEEPTRQSDIYSIGITLYEMLVGKTPFDMGTEYEIMEAHLKKNPGRVSLNLDSVPPEIDKIVAKSLEKIVQKRYLTCDEFIDDIEELIKKLDKSKPVGKKKKNNSDQLKYKLRATFYALFAITVFIGLSWVIFKAISDFWPTLRNKVPTTEADTTSAYRANPNYIPKSNWGSLSTNIGGTLNGIHFSDNLAGIAVGEAGMVILTSDGGATWQRLNSPDIPTINDIFCISIKSAITIGEKGAIYRTDDGGLTWRLIQSGVSETLFRISAAPNGNLFILGSKGVVLRSSDSGLTWKKMRTAVDKILYGISFADNNNGYIVGWSGTLLKTSDGGENWEIQTAFTDKYLKDIFFVDSETGFACGAGGEIHLTQDAGKSWKKAENKVYSGLVSLLFIDKNRGFCISNKGEILETDDAGTSWTVYQGGNYLSLSKIVRAANSAIYICGFNGLILKSNL